VNLDNIICFNRDDKGLLNVAYLGKAFSNEEEESKAYVQRFLDATKSDMLFSKKVVLVEGITEQLLIPVFANYEDKSIEDEHISVINIGGRYFKHFLKLFDSKNPNTINKKVACITDLDPVFTVNDDTENEKCYPFEKRDDLEEFKECSNSLVDDYAEAKHANIRSFSQQKGIGKTFEYAIAFENLQTDIFIGETIANKDELKNLIKAYNDGKTLDELLAIYSSKGSENKRIRKAISESGLSMEGKKKHLIASRYLNSISKGENAYELAQILQTNFEKGNPVNFKTPVYIKQAIDWLWK
jgi:predicted ATP-dependent endonuclease of OLD family